MPDFQVYSQPQGLLSASLPADVFGFGQDQESSQGSIIDTCDKGAEPTIADRDRETLQQATRELEANQPCKRPLAAGDFAASLPPGGDASSEFVANAEEIGYLSSRITSAKKSSPPNILGISQA